MQQMGKVTSYLGPGQTARLSMASRGMRDAFNAKRELIQLWDGLDSTDKYALQERWRALHEYYPGENPLLVNPRTSNLDDTNGAWVKHLKNAIQWNDEVRIRSVDTERTAWVVNKVLRGDLFKYVKSDYPTKLSMFGGEDYKMLKDHFGDYDEFNYGMDRVIMGSLGPDGVVYRVGDVAEAMHSKGWKYEEDRKASHRIAKKNWLKWSKNKSIRFSDQERYREGSDDGTREPGPDPYWF